MSSEETKNLIGHYIDNCDGTVTDTRTGLMWMRCVMGQIWDGKSCHGEARNFTWDGANKLRHNSTFAGCDDWRLPDIDELKTLIDRSQDNQAIDNRAFPNTPRSLCWSSSPYSFDSNYAWVVNCYSGNVYNVSRNDYNSVRLVRYGQGVKSMGEVTLQPLPAKVLPWFKMPCDQALVLEIEKSSPEINTNKAFDEIMAFPAIQQLIPIAIESGQPITSFCNDHYKELCFSHNELFQILNFLIECCQIDYTSGILSQVLKQHKDQDIWRKRPQMDRMLEKIRHIVLTSSSREKNHPLNQSSSSLHTSLDPSPENESCLFDPLSVDALPTDDPSYSSMPLVSYDESAPGSWTDLIGSSSLSVRATNVLLNNCASLEDLLSLDHTALLNFKNCGKNTVTEIIEFQNKMRAGGFPPALPLRPLAPPVADILKLPPSEESLRLLPIFSSKLLDCISVNELHEGFQVEMRLADIVLSVRAASVLHRLGYKTIGEIMFIPGATLLKEKNFGRKCFNEIQDVIKKIVIHGNNQSGSLADKLDFSSYAAMVESFTHHCLQKKSQELVSKRLCFQTEKIPTLEQLGERLAITRERARQILKKGYATLKIKTNLDLLKGFRESIDTVVTIGGGIITLGGLSTALQEKYGWLYPPNPPALGQLLSLLKPNQLFAGAEDLVMVECECLTCEKPFEKLLSLDFEEHESFHIRVASSNLAKHCQENCVVKPVQTFHQAYIERLIRRTNGKYVIHNDLIMPRDTWLPRYGVKLEDIIINVLERNGKPMHFSEITPIIQKENITHSDISDHNVHAALMRFDTVEITNRGTYGLKSWGMGGYRSVSTAIEELLDASDRPLRRAEINQQLGLEFSEFNISASLGTATRFVSVGEGFYDRPERWRQRTYQSLIEQLPKPLAEFARYLVGNNNYSYKFVLALVFVRGMDENGSFYLPTLKERFFSFYLSRKKRGLIVEIDSSIISRIGEIEDSVIKNTAADKPMTSFLSSPFFVQNGSAIFLQGDLVSLLSDLSIRNLFIVIMLKKIDDYFAELTPAVFHGVITGKTEPVFVSGDDDNTASSSITIKKKDRGKIRL